MKRLAALANIAAREHPPGTEVPDMELEEYALDVLINPRVEGASFEFYRALFRELFAASNKRQAAELGEVMRIRADERRRARSP